MNTYYGVKPLNRIAEWEPIVSTKNWVPTRSAYELAHSWGAVDGFPDPVAKALANTEFAGLRVQHGVVEMPVYLDTFKAPSMTDLMVYCDGSDGKPVVIGVEAKADESFDKTVERWVRPKGEMSPTRKARLAFLSDGLGIEISTDSELRYQLLHRTYSVISEARRVRVAQGIVLVHSFSDANPQN